MTSVGTAAEWLMIFYRASLTSDLTDFLLVTFHYEANNHFLLYFLAIFQLLLCALLLFIMLEICYILQMLIVRLLL